MGPQLLERIGAAGAVVIKAPGELRRFLKEWLRKAGAEVDPDEYFSGVLTITLAVSAILLLLDLTILIPFVPATLLVLPKQIARQRARKVERELPFILGLIGTRLEAGLPLPEAIKVEPFVEAVEKYERGTDFAEALRNFSERYDSSLLEEVVSHLLFLYYHGEQKSGETLKALRDRIVAEHVERAKIASGRISMITLAFVAISSVVPTMLQSYFLLGGVFLGFDPNLFTVLLLGIVPICQLGILVLARGMYD